jgi:hypothetical protein
MRRHALLLGSLLVLVLGGCGGKSKLHKFEGTVTLDGKPLPGAQVQFIREKGEGTPANAVTGTDGSFRLSTFSTGDGAMAGDYKVLVSIPQTSGPEGGQPDPQDPKSMTEAMKKFAETKKTQPQKPTVPANYSDISKTPLRQRIPAEGSITLELRSTGA